MSYYIIAIGGTGARCVEAIAHLAATGLFAKAGAAERVQILFIDPDESNGNLRRTKDAIETYQSGRSLLGEGNLTLPWLQTPLENLEVWSPFHGSTNKSLATFFNYEGYKFGSSALGHLFDVLYTKGEREAELDVGFRGRPAIGAAVMSQVNLDQNNQEPWRTLIQQIELDVGQGKSPKLFLCGSIFGGTGASGFPTIGRLLKNKLQRAGMLSRVKLGGLLMLPYFQFSIPPGQDPGDIYARPEQFLLNTEAALRYYQGQDIFDRIYLLGDQEPAAIANFSIGKNTQNNEPHFIEFFAALTARNFFLDEDSQEKVVLISHRDEQRIVWDDIPARAEVKPALVNATRFAYLWLNNIVPDLKDGKQNPRGFLKSAPWSGSFFKLGRGALFGGRGLPELGDEIEQEAISRIGHWCEAYLRWLGLMHRSGGSARNVQLFRTDLILDGKGNLRQAGDDLSKLVIGSDGQESSQQPTSQMLKEQLMSINPTRTGAVGLAESLYPLCKA
jgi:hypothetical protein